MKNAGLLRLGSAAAWLWLAGCGAGPGEGLAAVRLSDEEAQRIGQRVWQNECAGTVEGLTSWNEGEQFASLGIGHFIWYPAGMEGPFEERFPALLAYLRGRGVALPPSLAKAPDVDCPWAERRDFLRDFQGERMREIRALLAATVSEQGRFLVVRLEAALPKMLEEAGPGKAKAVRERFQRVLSARGGAYVLVDYVNFKGEGTRHTERYKGQGWGLLQVLENMEDGGDPVGAFSRSAGGVLRRRVANSPPERNEARWLKGWLNRVGAYAQN